MAGIGSKFRIAEVLSGVGHAALKRDFALARVGVNEIDFGANNVDYYVGGDVFLEFDEPEEISSTIVSGKERSHYQVCIALKLASDVTSYTKIPQLADR